jgi:hypothetical protein
MAKVTDNEFKVKSNKLREVVHDERSVSPSGFNAATLRVIEFLGGDTRTGKCFCPCHPDGSKPSLSVSNGNKRPTVIHCFGKESKAHDNEVVAYLKKKKIWPSSSKLAGASASVAAEGKRTPEERRNDAVNIWDRLAEQDDKCRDNEGRRISELLLRDYFHNRKLKVPNVALVSMPWPLAQLDRDQAIGSNYPAMVLPVVDRHGELQGIHATWLSPDLQTKLVPDDPNEPVRQTFGLLKGNFITLQELDYTKPIAKLLIGEGPETVLSAMKLTGLPGIATGGKGFFKHLKPPPADEYIALVDNHADGAARKDAGVLAQRLSERGVTVRLAMPEKPAGGQDGFDWNDADMGADAPGMEALLRDQILQAPVFSIETMTKDEKYKKGIRELGKLKSRERDEKRKAIKDEFGVRTKTIDEDVEEERRKEAEAEAEAEPTLTLEQLAESARLIIDSEDPLEMFLDDIAHDIAGEHNNLKIMYLMNTSRLFERPMSGVLGGPSSGGKSQIRQFVLRYFPPEDIIEFTSVSEKALLHIERGFEHKILSMAEALSVEDMKFQDYLLRELISSNQLRHLTTVKQDDRMVGKTIEKNGPVVFLVTTTKASLNAENETRLVRLEVDESEEQTKNVLAKIAELHGLNMADADPDLFRPWQDFQRWLAMGETRVEVPYAQVLAGMLTSYRATRLRRDFSQFLTAIKAHTLLRRQHCRCKEDGTLLANIKNDYAAVRALMVEIMASAAEVRLTKRNRETVKVVAELTTGPRAGNATVRLVATKLRVDESTARRRLKQAEEADYIFNSEPIKNRPALYQLNLNQPNDADNKLLPTPKELLKEWRRQQDRKVESELEQSEPKVAKSEKNPND